MASGGFIIIAALDHDGPRQAFCPQGTLLMNFFSRSRLIARHLQSAPIEQGGKQRGAIGEQRGSQAFFEFPHVAGALRVQPPAGDLEGSFRFLELLFARHDLEFFFAGNNAPLRSVRISVSFAYSSVSSLYRL